MIAGLVRQIVLLATTLACAGSSIAQHDLQTPRGSIPLRNDRLVELHGVLLIDPKIIGGRYATVGDDPWQVALFRADKPQTDRRPFCGGALILSMWVLTAAHCVDRGTLPTDFDVLGGTANVDKGGMRVKVAEIYIHPNYVETEHLNDIALVRLQQPILASQAREISILPLAMEASTLTWKSTARVTGWGGLSEGGLPVAELRYVELTVYSNKDCNDRVAYDGAVAKEMVCAGFTDGGKDSCQGDSGGPLTVVADKKRYLAGVVSWGEGCGRQNKYGVYTRAAHYLSWINECTSGNPGCRQLDPEKQKGQAAFVRDAAFRRAIHFTKESK